MGLSANDGVVRISFAHYNTEEETGRIINALGKALL